MDIAILKEFQDLAASLNYSSTAKRLNIAQSTLSKHIAALEKELDTRLFVRDSHSVRLTGAGRAFSERIAVVLADYDCALDAIADVKASINSTLDIGFIMAAPQRLIADACRLFKQRQPGVRLNVYSMEPEEVIDAVRKGKIDLGITMLLVDSVPADVVFNIAEREQYGALVDNRHPLASRSEITCADLLGERLLVPNPDAFPVMAATTTREIKKVLGNADIIEETSDLGCIGPIVSANNYVALTYSCTLRFFTEGYTFVPLSDFDIKAAIGPMWKESRENEGIYLFMRCLDEAAAQLGVR